MPRGRMNPETAQQRALEAAADFLRSTGASEEEIAAVIKPPLETVDDKMREAQSVINYFKANGDNYYQAICKECLQDFAYAWHIKSVSYCSVDCANEALKKLGLSWTPGKPVTERWGLLVPAIVPAPALKAIRAVLDTPKPHESEDSSES